MKFLNMKSIFLRSLEIPMKQLAHVPQFNYLDCLVKLFKLPILQEI